MASNYKQWKIGSVRRWFETKTAHNFLSSWMKQTADSELRKDRTIAELFEIEQKRGAMLEKQLVTITWFIFEAVSETLIPIDARIICREVIVRECFAEHRFIQGLFFIHPLIGCSFPGCQYISSYAISTAHNFNLLHFQPSAIST